MKFFITAGLLLAGALAQAQNRAWDIRFGGSGGTYPFLQEGGQFATLNIFQPEWEESSYSESILYRLNKYPQLRVGLSAAQTTLKQYHLASWFTGDSTYPVAKQNILSFMPTINYAWLERRRSCLYSEVCVGPAFKTTKSYGGKMNEFSMTVAFHGTAIGYRFGGRIAGFIEFGYGYKGLAQIGISGQL